MLVKGGVESKPASKSVVAKIVENAKGNGSIGSGKIPGKIIGTGALKSYDNTARAAQESQIPELAVRALGPVEVFRSGDKIVYPGHGVGEIDDIRKTTIGGQEHQFYSIKITETGMKVMVPVSQASSVGLRRIVDKRAVDRVYEILRDRNFKIDTQTWNRRYREYSQKIKTGSVYEIAMVLRDLSVLGNDKELSFGEKKMRDMAEGLLASELALAKARPADKIVTELRELFA